MSNFWSSFFGKDDEERLMNQNQWAQQYMQYQGSRYPLGGHYPQGNVEPSPGDEEWYATYALMGNPIIFTLCTTRMMLFAQARFMYQNFSEDGRPDDLEWDPALKLFAKPWPNGQATDLLCKMIQDVDLYGNFFAVTEGTGQRKRLRRLKPNWVDIVLSSDPKEAAASDVEGYIYKPGNTPDKSKWKLYPVDGSNGQVCHWAPYPDPMAQYRGMSWMTPTVRDIMADVAAAKHKGKFFENAATPNIAVRYPEDTSPDELAEFIELMKPKHGINAAYETLFLGGGADVTVIGAKMDQMAFKDVIGHGETRLAAAAGIHPVVAGLSEAMQGASLNAGNFGQAKRSTADKTLVYLWTTASNALSVLVPEKSKKRLWYDDRDIPFMREDQEAMANILNIESGALLKLVREGFTPESIVQAMMKSGAKGAWELLEHSGLLSVQLQPPGATTADADGNGVAGKQQNPAKKTEAVKKPAVKPAKTTPKRYVIDEESMRALEEQGWAARPSEDEEEGE